jgi:hypothetical protein
MQLFLPEVIDEKFRRWRAARHTSDAQLQIARRHGSSNETGRSQPLK